MTDRRVLKSTSDPFDLAAELFCRPKLPNSHVETIRRIFVV